MQYGLDVANQGVAADPRRVVELALAAEKAGWDGLFVWDHWGFAWGMASVRLGGWKGYMGCV
jgi:alkanesulfonate monooxygenase SsuD/methylene tetrahydromethanopterin reductase-like flavin-dependent oxidoreductase (luciferase family)